MVTRHGVQQGETIQTIAKKHGFRQWRRVYEHPDNAALRHARPNPNVLAVGDVVVVPDLDPKTEPAIVDERTVFVLPRNRCELVLRVQGPDGESLSGTGYRVVVGGAEFAGVVAASGLIRHDIPIDSRKGTLFLDAGHLDPSASGEVECALEIGALEPVETDSGVRARLHNLGFLHEKIAEPGDPMTISEAMTDFRRYIGLPPLDDALSPQAREDLLFEHGS